MKIQPVKGTRDILPAEARLRDHLQRTILDTYTAHGFERIYTPIMEELDNLTGSEGGENLGLMFKVLKRGDKLRRALESGGEPADMGLRYDLTLPLSRFYAAHRNELSAPFKVIQIDRAFRAEQPQQGRLRDFFQCDIDIVGLAGWDAELELIVVTARALKNIGLRDFTIRINDKRLLGAVLSRAGFLPETHGTVCIALDKLDKIGIDGVRAELLERADNPEAAQSLMEILPCITNDIKAAADYAGGGADDLNAMMEALNGLDEPGLSLRFDLTLVRGQGYYTGMVFEIAAAGYPGSVGGGGRYDRMIGKFIGQDIPAVGFSIGFERIAALLQGSAIPGAKPRAAVLYSEITPALTLADGLRGDYDVALYPMPKKLGAFLSKLEAQGFTAFCVQGRDDGLRTLGS